MSDEPLKTAWSHLNKAEVELADADYEVAQAIERRDNGEDRAALVTLREDLQRLQKRVVELKGLTILKGVPDDA